MTILFLFLLVLIICSTVIKYGAYRVYRSLPKETHIESIEHHPPAVHRATEDPQGRDGSV